MKSIRRRQFLAGAGALGLSTLAGCSAVTEDTSESANVTGPNVPTTELRVRGWKQIDTMSGTVLQQEFGPFEVTAEQKTVRYEDKQLRQAVKKGTLGKFDSTLSQFFATRIDLDPDLNKLGLIQDRLLDRTETQAKRRLRRQLQNTGIANVSQTGTGTMDVRGGHSARVTELTGEYQVPSQDVTLATGETITIEGGRLDVTGLLALWVGNESILAAGGAYPAENFRREIRKDITSMIHATIVVDLGLNPDQLRNELLTLMQRVH